jgi:hypothetical protein
MERLSEFEAPADGGRAKIRVRPGQGAGKRLKRTRLTSMQPLGLQGLRALRGSVITMARCVALRCPRFARRRRAVPPGFQAICPAAPRCPWSAISLRSIRSTRFTNSATGSCATALESFVLFAFFRGNGCGGSSRAAGALQNTCEAIHGLSTLNSQLTPCDHNLSFGMTILRR